MSHDYIFFDRYQGKCQHPRIPQAIYNRGFSAARVLSIEKSGGDKRRDR
jgi:hypothetical protein